MTYCSMTPTCLLACWKDNGKCVMYFMIISRLYDPSTYIGDKVNLGKCFSRWFFNNDLTLMIKKVTSCPYNDHPEKALDGVYMSRPITQFNADFDFDNPWIQFELEDIKLIKAVLVIPRSSDTRFKNVLVEIGKTETTMKRFDSYGPIEATPKQVIEFKGIYGPMKGKFIRLSKINENILIIGEIAIIGA